MQKRRLVFLPLALAALLAANLRLVCSVSVAGEALPEIYAAGDVRHGTASALAAAHEISRGDAALPDIEVAPRISLLRPEGGGLSLARGILARTGGVASLWRVTVDGEDAGLCADPTALGEVLDTIVYEGAAAGAVAAELTGEVALDEKYAPPEFEADLMDIAARVRGLTEVMSVTGDGTVRYG